MRGAATPVALAVVLVVFPGCSGDGDGGVKADSGTTSATSVTSMTSARSCAQGGLTRLRWPEIGEVVASDVTDAKRAVVAASEALLGWEDATVERTTYGRYGCTILVSGPQGRLAEFTLNGEEEGLVLQHLRYPSETGPDLPSLAIRGRRVSGLYRSPVACATCTTRLAVTYRNVKGETVLPGGGPSLDEDEPREIGLELGADPTGPGTLVLRVERPGGQVVAVLGLGVKAGDFAAG